MNILVVLRMMPDLAGELELDAEGTSLDREWIDFQLNDFDDQALEEAILLKDSEGAKVTALAVGEGAERVLRMAIARGADEAIQLSMDDDGMILTPQLSAALKKEIEQRDVSLVLVGVQTPEDIFGQLAPYLGAVLDWPCLSGTNQVTFRDDKLDVAQERGRGMLARYRVALPAVLGVQTATKAPRYVSGSKLRQAAKTPIASIDNQPGELPGAIAFAQLASPPDTGQCENLGSSAEQIAEKLMELLDSRGLLREVKA